MRFKKQKTENEFAAAWRPHSKPGSQATSCRLKHLMCNVKLDRWILCRNLGTTAVPFSLAPLCNFTTGCRAKRPPTLPKSQTTQLPTALLNSIHSVVPKLVAHTQSHCGAGACNTAVLHSNTARNNRPRAGKVHTFIDCVRFCKPLEANLHGLKHATEPIMPQHH